MFVSENERITIFYIHKMKQGLEKLIIRLAYFSCYKVYFCEENQI